MQIKLFGVLVLLANVGFLLFGFNPLWAKINISIGILAYILGFFTVSSISDKDKLLHHHGINNYSSTFRTMAIVTGIASLIEIVSSVCLVLYFLYLF